MPEDLPYDLDGLAVDVFSLAGPGAAVESLTGAHAMTELAASCPPEWLCAGTCSGSCSILEPPTV
jgi:hypothetical protein